MTAPTNCGLCGDSLAGHGHDLVGGLALCRRCFLGDVQRVAEARGWGLWSKHAEVSRGDDNDRAYVTEVRVVLATEVALRAVIRRRRWWSAILGLIRPQARSGDPLFAAHVIVWSPQPRQAEEFLRRGGAESSVMDVLGNLLPSRVEIRGGNLTIRYVADDPHTEGEIVARACVLAHHVQQFAANGG